MMSITFLTLLWVVAHAQQEPEPVITVTNSDVVTITTPQPDDVSVTNLKSENIKRKTLLENLNHIRDNFSSTQNDLDNAQQALNDEDALINKMISLGAT